MYRNICVTPLSMWLRLEDRESRDSMRHKCKDITLAYISQHHSFPLHYKKKYRNLSFLQFTVENYLCLQKNYFMWKRLPL